MGGRSREAAADRVIATVQDLDAAMHWRSLLLHTGRMHLRLPGLTTDRATFWQAAVDQRIDACGCTEGSIGGAIFLAVFVLLYAVGVRPGGGGWATAGIGFIVFATGLVLGKLAGLARARLLLRRSMQELRAQVESPLP